MNVWLSRRFAENGPKWDRIIKKTHRNKLNRETMLKKPLLFESSPTNENPFQNQSISTHVLFDLRSRLLLLLRYYINIICWLTNINIVFFFFLFFIYSFGLFRCHLFLRVFAAHHLTHSHIQYKKTFGNQQDDADIFRSSSHPFSTLGTFVSGCVLTVAFLHLKWHINKQPNDDLKNEWREEIMRLLCVNYDLTTMWLIWSH